MKTGLMTVLALFGAPALAQEGIDGHGFPFVPGDGDLADLPTTWRPERQTAGSVAVEGLLEYADSTVVLATEDAAGNVDYTKIVDNLFGLNLGVHGALHERVAVAASMPVFFTSTGPDGGQGVGAGDLRLSAPIGLVLADSEDGGAGLSIVPFIGLPTGAAGQNLGGAGVSGGVIVPIGYTVDRLGLVANLGISGTPGPDVDALNLQGGPKLLASLGASYSFTDMWALRGELRLDPALTKNDISWAQSPGESQLSVRHRAQSGLNFTGGVASGFTRGVGAANWRAFLGMGYVGGKGQSQDTDGDGMLDKLDACPTEPETQNGYKDDDGCPDGLATVMIMVRDNEGAAVADAEVFNSADGSAIGKTDASGVLRLEKQMPEQPLLLEVRAAKMAEADVQTLDLKEGENGAKFELSWLPGRVRVRVRGPDGMVQGAKAVFQGPQPREGGPVPEGDHVFFLGAGKWEVLVSADGLGAERRTLEIKADEMSTVEVVFSLKKAKVQVSLAAVELKEQVFFDSGKASIKSESYELLDEVANTLALNPQIKKIEIQGHTDSQGPDASNLKLSQTRVDSVKAYLVTKGVSEARLVSVGYGETKPIADNKTASGRAQNRRVEITILELDTVKVEQ